MSEQYGIHLSFFVSDNEYWPINLREKEPLRQLLHLRK